MDRRDFISLLPATFAFAMSSCKPPSQKIVPAVEAVEYIKQGVPNYYSTVFQIKNAAYGAVIKVINGRPVKVEGNELHPADLGSSSAFMQTALYSLYDPIRFRKPLIDGKESETNDVISEIKSDIENSLQKDKKVRIIIDEHCSQSFSKMILLIESSSDQIKFVTIPPIMTNEAAINKKLLGLDSELLFDFSRTELVLSIGNDFLGTDKYSHFYNTLYPSFRNQPKSRLITCESIMTLTGANSDERIILNNDEYDKFIQGVLNNVIDKIGDENYKKIKKELISSSSINRELKEIIDRIADLLVENKGLSQIFSGDYLSTSAKAATVCLNFILKAFGNEEMRMFYNKPMSRDHTNDFDQFLSDLRLGEIDTILIADSNIQYFGTSELKNVLATVPNKHSLSYYSDETSYLCKTNVPLSHQFESWGDALNFDGSMSIGQPVIAPLNSSSLSIEEYILKVFLDQAGLSYYDYLRNNLSNKFQDDRVWEKVLRDGFYTIDSNSTIDKTDLLTIDINAANELLKTRENYDDEGLTLIMTPSHSCYDGEFRQNAFMLELPDPITNLTWGNAALISKMTAKKHNLSNGEVIKLISSESEIEIPVLIQNGMADSTIAISYGYGGEITVNDFETFGANVFKLRSNAIKQRTNVSIEKTNKKIQFPISTSNGSYDIFDESDNDNSNKDVELGFIDRYKYKGHHWTMALDLTLCTGCNACLSSCQSENNIPIVGPEEIRKGRLLHWINIDKHYDETTTTTTFQPLLCHHCDKAPCESVCPASASTHSPEGINETTYNRCIGTRYCMVNCPYKVRRFNFSAYKNNFIKPLNLALNPNVTVRMRGIVEKCSFCIQRINDARNQSRDKGNRKIRDGVMKTACQQACPSGAITFGDLNDKESDVSILNNNRKVMSKFENLNLKPSVFYLPKTKDNK